MINKIKQLTQSKQLTIILCVLIFSWTFINSFFGIDMGDTGLHTYVFQNIYNTPDMLSFTSYFTAVVGWVWMKVFGFLGLWGLNFLEVLLEMTIVFIVYKTFKKQMHKNVILLGSLIAVCASGTYLNVFNYHQFNVLLIVLLMSAQYKAIVKNDVRYSFLAGFLLGVTVFARTGSVTACVTVLLYLFWYLVHPKITVGFLSKHILSIFFGGVVASGCMVLLLYTTGQLGYFINNIFRLGGLAAESGGGYSFNNLLESFLTGNLDAIGAGLVFIGGAIIVFFAMLFAFRFTPKEKRTRKPFILSLAISAVFLVIGIYIMKYAYDVNPVPAWPQMTTGPSFLIGFMYVVAIFSFIHCLQKNKEKALMIIISIFLPLLTIAGSNTGTKHVILGMWIIAPIMVDYFVTIFIKKAYLNNLRVVLYEFGFPSIRKPILITCVIVIVMFSYKLGNTIYLTTNFDSIHRTELRYSIQSENAKLLRTTKRQADSVNGVLTEIAVAKTQWGEDVPLMVYGSSVLFYYLADSIAYVQPWINLATYPVAQFSQDLIVATGKYNDLPVVVYCKTNNYYGFYEEKLAPLTEEQRRNKDSGKKEVLGAFLKNNKYVCNYENDYYAVFLPSEDGMEDYSKIKEIMGLE